MPDSSFARTSSTQQYYESTYRFGWKYNPRLKSGVSINGEYISGQGRTVFLSCFAYSRYNADVVLSFASNPVRLRVFNSLA